MCTCADEDGTEDDSDKEERPAPDPEDGWMLELSNKQLLKVLAQVSAC